MSETPELLPCPFCGGEAERITISDDEYDLNFGGGVIQCSRCLASSHVEFGFKENLVSAWNTRSDTAARNAALEEAARVADELFYPDETKISARIRDAIRAMKHEDSK